MAKRYNPRAFKLHHNYTIQEVAEGAGVHVQTVRGWIKRGLPCLRSRKPFLILGCDIRAHLEHQNETKAPLGPNELYCLKCRAARRPWGMLADLIRLTASTGRLNGLCPVCDTYCQRFVSLSEVGIAAPDLDITNKGQEVSLNRSHVPPSKTHKPR